MDKRKDSQRYICTDSSCILRNIVLFESAAQKGFLTMPHPFHATNQPELWQLAAPQLHGKFATANRMRSGNGIQFEI